MDYSPTPSGRSSDPDAVGNGLNPATGSTMELIMSTWTLEALRQKRDEIIATAVRWGARDVCVLGSVAPGKDVVTARAMRPRFRERVEKDAVPL